MDHLRQNKQFKNKRLENNFKPIDMSINDMDNIYKKHLV